MTTITNVPPSPDVVDYNTTRTTIYTVRYYHGENLVAAEPFFNQDNAYDYARDCYEHAIKFNVPYRITVQNGARDDEVSATLLYREGGEQ